MPIGVKAFALNVLTTAGAALAPLLAHAQPVVPPFKGLELDLTSREYEKLLGNRGNLRGTDSFAGILAAGKRNLAWIDAINAARPNGPLLELSTPATQRGYPIDQPTHSNRTIVDKAWRDLTATLPAFMTDIIVGGAAFVTDLPISDEEFLTDVRLVDRIYQNASRWLLEEPYLDYYAQVAADDVRGYYHLNATDGVGATLSAWATLPVARQTELRGWLIGECRNTEGLGDTCARKLSTVLAQDGNPLNFHETYFPKAAAHWDAYFKIAATRTDVTWTSADAATFSIPFRDPGRDDVKAWLVANIQDEWRWKTVDANFQLVLAFQPGGADDVVTHVKFVAGATPHVNAVAGNEITMDANRNLTEYTSRWTIRHEYGHVLGFPDCYIEFYDADAGEMINYQLDIDDLMCSRRGHFQQRHFDELKRVYFKQ